jgi:hypothetical protein
MDMLWLSGFMGVLAACAFAFLAYLLTRRPKADIWEEPDRTTPERNVFAAKIEADPLRNDEAEDSREVAPANGSQTENPPYLEAGAAVERSAEDKQDPSIGDWFASDETAPEFRDFDPAEDDLVVVWDDSLGPKPTVQIRHCNDDPALGQIVMDDVIVAQFRTKPDATYDHVPLIPFSAARTLGWAGA